MIPTLALAALLATVTPVATTTECGTVFSTDTPPVQGGRAIVCYWHFPEGTPSAYTGCGSTPRISYSTVGTHEATLTVCWADQTTLCNATTVAVDVVSAITTIDWAEINPATAYVGQPVDLFATATGPEPLTYRWTVPGRGVFTGAMVTLDTTGWTAANYNVSLVVSSSLSGTSATWSGTLMLLTPPPAAFAARCPSGTCMFETGEWVTFTYTGTASPTLWQYDWDGNGSFEQTSTAKVLSHAYELESWVFYPSLRVTYGGGQVYTFQHLLPLMVLNPYGLVFRDGFEAGTTARWSARRP